MISVTSLKNLIFEPFDDELVINTNYSKWKSNKENKYYNLIDFIVNELNLSDDICKNIIKTIWKFKGRCSISRGKILHKLIENYLNKEPESLNNDIIKKFHCLNCDDYNGYFNPELFKLLVDEEDCNTLCKYLTNVYILKCENLPLLSSVKTYNFIKCEYDLFKTWVNNLLFNFKLYKTEWKIKSERLNLVGVVDAVFCYNDSPNDLLLVDWKRNANIELENPFGKTGLKPPFTSLPDCNFGHYSMQLNIYGRMIEQSYEPLKIRKMLIVQITDLGVTEYEVKRLF